MDGAATFGEWLQQRRQALRLTRPELAQRANCSVPALRKIEIGERRPSRELAETLAKALGLSPQDSAVFIRVARGELNLERLPSPARTEVAASSASPAARQLPIPPTPLIGREAELAAVARLLADQHCRLLTITGPGGIGKTRLAIEAASAHAANQATYFVLLAALSSAELIPPAIAEVLGLMFSGAADPAAQLVRYLRDKSMLLVLDNLEHLLDGVGWLATLLDSAPDVRILVTSRERLNLKTEWAFELHGLPVPAAEATEAGLAPSEGSSSAVGLFVQSARRAQAGFEPQPGDRPAMADICRLVAGVPLAIELAAGWVRMLSCAEIAAELKRTLAADPSLEFLATSMRDVPERHRSMRAVIDHSWRLLSDEEQRALRQLAVFRGGFTRDAAEAVAGAPLTQLSALAAKSLVQRGGSGRFDLHELIRQYAAARLATEAPEQRDVRQRHSLYYLGLLEEGGDLSSRPKESLAALVGEMSNIRLAWEWAATHEDGARLCQVSITLWYLFELLNWLMEGELVFQSTAETLRRRGDAERNGARQAAIGTARQLMLAHAAYFAFRLGRLEAAYATLRSSAAAMSAAADPYAAIVVYWYLGIVCWACGRYDEANASLQESLANSRVHGKVLHEAWSLEFLGFVAHDQGAYEQARKYFGETLSTYRQTGDRLAKSHVLYSFGRTLVGLGDYDQAETLLREALALAREVGYQTAAAGALDGLGRVAGARGDLQAASTFFAESGALFAGMGDIRRYAQVLAHQALNELALGDAERAEQSILTALRLAYECGSVPVVLEVLASLATMRSAAPELTVELVSLVLAHPASTQDARNLAARANIQPQSDQMETARQRARAQDLAEVVRRVLATG